MQGSLSMEPATRGGAYEPPVKRAEAPTKSEPSVKVLRYKRTRPFVAPEPWVEFVSLTITSHPMSATLRAKVRGVERVFTHIGGVGPINAMCIGLRDLDPEVARGRCWTDEPDPRSDAVAKAHAKIEWGGITFRGYGEDLNTLNASAKAVLDAFNKLDVYRKCDVLGGHMPVLESDGSSRWAGFFVKEKSKDRSQKGKRELVSFEVAFEPGIGFQVFLVGKPKGRRREEIAKAWHVNHAYDLVRCFDASGKQCDLFVTKVAVEQS